MIALLIWGLILRRIMSLIAVVGKLTVERRCFKAVRELRRDSLVLRDSQLEAAQKRIRYSFCID